MPAKPSHPTVSAVNERNTRDARAGLPHLRRSPHHPARHSSSAWTHGKKESSVSTYQNKVTGTAQHCDHDVTQQQQQQCGLLSPCWQVVVTVTIAVLLLLLALLPCTTPIARALVPAATTIAAASRSTTLPASTPWHCVRESESEAEGDSCVDGWLLWRVTRTLLLLVAIARV